MTTVRILGSRAREQVPGTSITLLAPGFRGSLTQLGPGIASRLDLDLPFAEAAAGAEVMLAAQLNLHLEARQDFRPRGLRSRSALVTHPRVIVPRRPGVTYALLQTDETGTSGFLAPQPGGDEREAAFLLSVSATSATRRTLRVLMWPDLQAPGEGSLAIASRWERLRRPNQLAQRALNGLWHAPDTDALKEGAVLLLLHDTFSTPQATFADWLDDAAFAPLAQRYQGCLAFTHPTLSAGIDENLDWLVNNLASMSGTFDVVAHGRGGLLASALAADGRLRLRRVCQVGTPNNGTPLARESCLTRFLDAHVAMLSKAPKGVAQGTLEGALCLARCIGLGQRVALPGMEALTPESASLRGAADFHSTELEWFTVGAQFALPEGHACEPAGIDDFAAAPNDLVVPAQGCHEPGAVVSDSLHLADVHHHGYFAEARVRGQLAAWFM